MKVWHMNGAGNDFMVMDARGGQYDFEKLARELCALSGADGFMAVDSCDDADFLLHFYNSDGSRAELCGNGSRCICRFAYDNGIAGENMVVRTDAGLVYGWRLSQDIYRVQLSVPEAMDLNRKENVAYVEVGCPHGVLEVPGLQWSDADSLREMARSLRFDPAFPKGANIDLYTWLGEGQVRVLTFERGVEDYTLACGTGCSSVAATLFAQGKLPGKRLTAHNRGGVLTVELVTDGDVITALYLEGPTQIDKIYQLDI